MGLRVPTCCIQNGLSVFSLRQMPQFAQRLPLNLADALPCDRKPLTDLLQGASATVVNSETHAKNLLFAGREGLQHCRRLLLQIKIDHQVCR